MPERPVWENLSVYSLPGVYGHQHSGQPTQCLDGLVTYAAAIADRSESYAYDTPEKIMRWPVSYTHLHRSDGDALSPNG